MTGLELECAQPVLRTAIAREISEGAVVKLDSRPVHETERGIEILADDFVGQVAIPRLVGEVETDAVGMVVADGIGKAALIIEVRRHGLAGNELGVAKLEVRARDSVAREAGGIAIGEDESD